MPSELDRIFVHLSGDLFGSPGTPQSLLDLVGQLPAASVVQSAAKIVHRLERPGSAYDLDRQRELIELFPPSTRNPLTQLLESGSEDGGFDIVFHRQQLLTLMRIALARGKPGPPASLDTQGLLTFITAAAQVNDITDSYIQPWISAATTLPTRKIAIWKLRSIAMHRDTNYLRAAGRAYLMWAHSRLPWPTTVEHPDDFSLRTFGCTLKMARAIGVAPAFSALDAVSGGSPGQAVINPRRYFAQMAVEETVAQTVLESLTYVPGEPTIVEDEASYFGWTDVAARPFMPAGEDLLVVASPQLAFERATTGIFWMLHSSLLRTPQLTPLTDHFGRMFEDYILRLAQDVSGDRLRVSGEIVYGQPERRTSDVLLTLVSPRPARVFVEVGTVRPRREVLEYGDESSFDEYVDRLAGKLMQLDKCITEHQQGRFAIPNDPVSSGVPYLPVLVVDEPFTWSPELRDLLEAHPDVRELFSHPAVAKPVVCSISEYEWMIHAVEQGSDLAELLTEFLGTGRDIPFEMYLHHRLGTLDLPSRVRGGFQALTSGWVQVLGLRDE